MYNLIPLLLDEERRLLCLPSYYLYSHRSDPTFDRIVELALEIFRTPICLVSLIGEDRQWMPGQADALGNDVDHVNAA